MKKFDVVALGEAMLEFNQTRPGQPEYLQGFGGDTSNAVIAASRAGAKTAYLSRLGQDTFGQALMALWAITLLDLWSRVYYELRSAVEAQAQRLSPRLVTAPAGLREDSDV